jgi:hypothetical protein
MIDNAEPRLPTTATAPSDAVGTEPALPTGIPAGAVPAAAMERFLSRVRDRVREGFDDREDLVESAATMLAEDAAYSEPKFAIGEDAAAAIASAVVDSLLDEHGREQANWKAPTDCDRLDAALAELESRGVVARQNFTCCGTCGNSEIWGEIDNAPGGRESVRGYVYYHEQDTERAASGGRLFFSYGANSDGPDPAGTAVVGRELADVLKRAGFTVEWDGDPDSRVLVIGLDWKRRR